MSRPQSPATQMRALKRDRNYWREEAELFKVRATQLEAEVARLQAEVSAWKSRFDALLKRDQVKP